MSTEAHNVELAGEFLTQKQEDFARHYIECRNATTAYRLAYNAPEMAPWVYVEASRALHHPKIALRIAELRALGERESIIKAREVFGDWADMAATDANELVRLKTVCCRHCWGRAFRYQWYDEAELAEACEAAQRDIDAGLKLTRMPDALGGFDYRVNREPNPECIKCSGQGRVLVRFTDTDALSVKARKLYKGAKVGANGTIELLMHDAAAARVEMAKALKLYEKGASVNPAAPVEPIAEDVTEAEAAQAYLTLVQS